MFDPRIYRTSLVVVALAALVLAFSFDNQQEALSSRLAPDAFNGNNVYASMMTFARKYPDRSPGTSGDDNVADAVSRDFKRFGFARTTDTFSARTPAGVRTLENVVGVRAGMQSGSVLIIAHRDGSGSPSKAGLSGTEAALSGTATLIELARDLEGETLHRTVVLASTSGSQGTAGGSQPAPKALGPIGAGVDVGRARAQQRADHAKFLGPGHFLVNRGVLAGEREQLADLDRVRHHVVPADAGVPAVRLQQRGQDAHDRGLARPVRAEQGEHPPGVGGNVHPGQGLGVAESFGQPFGCDNCGHGGPIS